MVDYLSYFNDLVMLVSSKDDDERIVPSMTELLGNPFQQYPATTPTVFFSFPSLLSSRDLSESDAGKWNEISLRPPCTPTSLYIRGYSTTFQEVISRAESWWSL